MKSPFFVSGGRLRRHALGPILAFALVGCGSSGAGPDGNNNTSASNAPDDCKRETRELLAFNVGDTTSWQGPISSYRQAPRDWPKAKDWSPLRLTSAEDSSHSANGSRGTGAGAPAQCEPIHQAITGHGVGDYGTQDFRMLDLRIEHDVTDFTFPENREAALAFKSPAEVKTKSRLVLTFMRHHFKPDGKVDPSAWEWKDEDQQKFDIDATCEKPFTVELKWEEASQDNGFCKPPAAGAQKFECPYFHARYTAEKCTFTAKDVDLKLVDGTRVKVSLGGTFDLPREENYGTKGYVVSIDAVDIH